MEQPLTVIAYLPGEPWAAVQTSDGRLGLINALDLDFVPKTEKAISAAVEKYGYQRLEPKQTVKPEELRALLERLA